MSLEIIKAGIQTLVQDYGRFGLQHYGITNSGPMDEHAFLWANKLLDNNFNAPQLEVCIGGLEAIFNHATRISICGADTHAMLNQKPINNWQTYWVNAGDVLSMGISTNGLYSYVAIDEGFNVEPQLSSSASVMREHIGGLTNDGESIKAGDSIPYTEKANIDKAITFTVPSQFIPEYKDVISIRFYPNQTGDVATSVLETFCLQGFTVSNKINRMGYRLNGEAIQIQNTKRLSQGISTGMIQLPPDGQPIVLMKDRQTIGGYPVLGCVASLDLFKLSQSKPNTQVRFEAVALDAIETEYREHLEFFDVMLS